VLKQNGEPSETTAYLLNGDIADRGEDAVEIFVRDAPPFVRDPPSPAA